MKKASAHIFDNSFPSILAGENGAVTAQKRNQPPRLIQPLSPRERQILTLLANGETTASAANHLGVCESTVRTHVERMRSKLSANTRAAIVAEGFRLGYLSC